jgi:DNA-binding NarL/FixJ family response regulator
VNILLCDYHRLMRDGLKTILQSAGFNVVGEAEDGRQSIELALQLCPDVVVMDISMPELNGIDATRLLLERWPPGKVIGLSMNSDRRYVLAMFAAGAVGYLLKTAGSDELIQAVQVVASGLKYVSPAVAAAFVDDYLAHGAGGSRRLSRREREVLQLLAEGKSSRHIATRLAIASTTVETHRRQIMNKLAIRSVAELTKYAVREGLTSLG